MPRGKQGITIRPFQGHDQQGVISLIVSIQREEFGIDITAEEQPDLFSIPDFYQMGLGNFWVAKRQAEVIGTIALKDIGSGQSALRKMFVAAPFRGRDLGVAVRLLNHLIAHAQERRITEIFLGTTDRFLAAHRFYEKSGFALLQKEYLPKNFPLMGVDTRFYKLTVG